ncbi:MAG: structural protein [Lentisphaerae bacterium]|nr:structural protein [Lentisphaerota bacterium]
MEITAGLAALVFLVYLGHRAPDPEGAPMTDDQPRGIRNNNPGNIEDQPGNDWQGRTGHDGRYVIFSAPVWGIRAMARILDTYRARGVDTLAQILATWAPEHENPTSSYVAYVEGATGIDRGHVITRADYPAVIEAIIYFENGAQPYSRATITEGINRA